MFENILTVELESKYGKTAEIISKAGVALSLINPNNDFDFVVRVL